MCEEVPHVKMYYADEGSGLERSLGGWFRTILETGSGEECF